MLACTGRSQTLLYNIQFNVIIGIVNAFRNGNQENLIEPEALYFLVLLIKFIFHHFVKFLHV